MAAFIPLTHSAGAAETVVGHWEDQGFANTTTAGNALSIHAEVTAKKDGTGPLYIDTDIETSNGALMDNGTGCAKISLLSEDTVVSTYRKCSPQNPGRGLPWHDNTVRRSPTTRDQVPSGVSFDGIAFAFFNAEFCCEPVNIGELIKLAAPLLAPAAATTTP